eukprot:XP_024997550.1 uncharacterized protein LOC107052236 [Gallus gallus]
MRVLVFSRCEHTAYTTTKYGYLPSDPPRTAAGGDSTGGSWDGGTAAGLRTGPTSKRSAPPERPQAADRARNAGSLRALPPRGASLLGRHVAQCGHGLSTNGSARDPAFESYWALTPPPQAQHVPEALNPIGRDEQGQGVAQ